MRLTLPGSIWLVALACLVPVLFADGVFRFVGAIRLHNACLKCHVPFRQSLETRLAGLSISIPIHREESGSEQR
ncbi:MAG: hypothetical protein ACR2RV_03490 [Verrucomicrobiales bacterium]